MFELADRLVGIYKTDNCTKSVTINPHLIEETVPQSQAQPNITQVLFQDSVIIEYFIHLILDDYDSRQG